MQQGTPKTNKKNSKDPPNLRLHPPLRLLPPLPNPQLLTQHIPPIITRTIPPSHIPRLLQKRTQRPDRGPIRITIVFHGAISPFELFHLRIHASLRPALLAVAARDDVFVREELLQLAAHGGGVVVAGDFAQRFVEGDGAPVGVLGLGFGELFGFGGGAGFELGVRVGVFFVRVGCFGGGGLFGLGFGVGLHAEVVGKVFEVLGGAGGHPDLLGHVEVGLMVC